MSGRPAKRVRMSGVSYHDKVPLASENPGFDSIHFTEGRLWRIGNSSRMARVQRTTHQAAGAWESMLTWATPDNPNYALDPTGHDYDRALEQDVTVEETAVQVPAPKKKKTLLARRPHVVWKENYRQSYLDELVRMSGRGDFVSSSECPACTGAKGPAEYRCCDCFLPDLVCSTCCVKRHRSHPFHRIEKWTGTAFIKTSLKTLGLKVQLNHASMFCENPLPCHANLLVLHTNGIHSISIQFCGCSRAIPIHLQLLRRRLYPATQLSIRTCATFELLELLHKLALTTKGSTYDFYRCLEKLTDGTGTKAPKSRYRALLRMVLQWRHLKLLKWGGRGHDATGVAGTLPGQLAIACPSCPHPGVNIPTGWAEVPEDMKFLYAVFVCMDANFRLKNQLVSNYSQDPGLGIGWAYMVARQSYEEYVLGRANDADISTCVGFQALAKANTKFSAGLRYTGVGATVCGRSEMLFPLGVGNLQKGERYANMDFIFGSSIRFVAALLVIVSYDICCQWFINLWKRIENHWPDEIKPRDGIKLTPAIPKLHEKMHEQANHQVFSLNFIPGAGYTDCECPERVWSPHNSLGNSTKTQGPGSRQDVLDDHFGFWNWEKYINQGRTLVRRYRAAVADRNRQVEGLRGLEGTIPAEVVAKWEVMCVEWERDGFPKTKANPYHMEGICVSEAQAKKELANEESVFLKGGGSFPHATTASMFILLGLDLEDAQRRLRRTAKLGATPTDRQEGLLAEQRNSLLSRIRAWESLLPIYMPGLLQYRNDHPPAPPATSNPEDAPLMLPSQVPEPHRSRICATGLPAIEERLRTAQCCDALDSLRRILTLKSRMVQFKNQNLRGQREGTRSRTIIDRVHERARLSAEKYRKARLAKLALTGPGEWEEKMKVLEDGDVRGFQDANQLRQRRGRIGIWEDDEVERFEASVEEPTAAPQTSEFVLFNEPRSRRDGTGETRRTLSWIWTSSSAAASKDDWDALRVEWAKARARARRAKEGVMLLKEEMRRVLAFLEWKAGWWEERLECRTEVSKGLAEGIKAYAATQSAVQRSLSEHFRGLWKAPLQESASGLSEADAPHQSQIDGQQAEEDDDGSDDEDEEQPADEIFDPDDVA